MKYLMSIALMALVAFIPDSTALSEECQAEKDAAKECVKAIFQDAQEERGARKDAMLACYVDNGCDSPAGLMEAKKAKHEAKRQCKEALMTQVKPQMEACVQRSFPDFVFPDVQGGGKRGFGRGGRRHHGKRSGSKSGSQEEMLQLLCPTQEAQDAVQDCLSDLRSGGRRGGNRNEKRQCFQDNVSPACQAEVDEVKAALCDCGAEIMAQNSDAVQKMMECKAALASESSEEEDDSDSDSESDEKTPEQIGQRMVRRFCRRKGRRGGRRN